MPVLLQIRREAENKLNTETLHPGELFFATDTKQVYAGDGVSNVIISGTMNGNIVDRPSPGVPRRMFFANDEKKLYYDTGAEWIFIGPAKSITYQNYHYFMPCLSNYYHNKGDYSARRRQDRIYFSFDLGSKFVQLKKVVYKFIAYRTRNYTLTLNSNYANNGESYNVHSESKTVTMSLIKDNVYFVDATDLYDNVQVNMVCGLSVESNQYEYSLGLSIEYVGYIETT